MTGRVLRVRLLGVPISAIHLSDAVNFVAEAIAERRREYVCTCPVYTVMRAREDETVRAAIDGAGLATPDGMGVVWALRWLGHEVGRVYGPDLLLAACERGLASGWRHYFYGGAEGVAAALAQALAARFPGLQVAAAGAPPFRPLSREEQAAEILAINAAQADIVWVGLGSPKQDVWMADHRPHLTAAVLIGVGAAFDFLAGRVRQAPGWARRAGLEWAFRWMMEPRRLWRRYLVYNPRFVWAVMRQKRGYTDFTDGRG